MEEVGNILMRLGPVFALAFFVLVIGGALAMIAVAAVALWRDRRDRGHAIEPRSA